MDPFRLCAVFAGDARHDLGVAVAAVVGVAFDEVGAFDPAGGVAYGAFGLVGFAGLECAVDGDEFGDAGGVFFFAAEAGVGGAGGSCVEVGEFFGPDG